MATSHRAFDMASMPFGLLQPVDPSLAAGEADTLQWKDAVHVSVIEQWHYSRSGAGWPGYPSKIAISFDFRQPLGPQIDEAIQILEACEKQLEAEEWLPAMRVAESRGRARLDKYPFYLRLLDAKKAGVSVYQVAKHFRKQWWTVRTAIGAVEQLSVKGYRDLLLMSIRRTPR